jgi:ketosteroid isomerase-like protein
MKERFFSEQLISQFDDFKVEAEEFIDAGDWVVAIGTVSGRGESSGLEFSMRFVHLLEMRDGKVVRAYGVAGEHMDVSGKASAGDQAAGRT